MEHDRKPPCELEPSFGPAIDRRPDRLTRVRVAATYSGLGMRRASRTFAESGSTRSSELAIIRSGRSRAEA